MPGFISGDRARSAPTPSSSPANRHRSGRTVLAIVAAALLVIAGAAAPASAAISPRSELPFLHAKTRTFDRSLIAPTRVDARAAARMSANVTRETRQLERRSIPLGTPGRSTKLSSPSPLVAGRSGGQAAGPRAATVSPQVVAQPAPVVISNTPATDAAEACGGCEPPDPWIAVGPSHVVTTTNGMVRVTNRAGTLLMQEPTWALFAVPANRFDSDPRIIWDAFHSRWVGIVTTFSGDFQDNGLRLAVSETSDPTGGWLVYPIDSGPFLPDFPGISSSATRIVFVSDDFESGATFVGPTIIIADWSNILAGTSLSIDGVAFDDITFGHFRPAQMLSSAANTPVVFEDFTTGDPIYFEVTGTVATFNFVAAADLTVDYGIDPFTLPPDPVQPGPDAITNAADERPTDAVYRSGQLWFVATGDYNDGVNDWAMARYTVVSTAASGAGASAATDVPGADSGTHFFNPGVGINADGSVFVTATKTDPTSVYPTTVMGAVLAGSGIYPYQDISASDEAYTGTRWGDFIGVAADPSAAGAVWIQHELVETGGSWRTEVLRVASDGVAPSTPGTITHSLVPPATLGATVPVKVAWGASTDADSGVARYLVERSDDGGGFFGVTTAGTSITQPLLVGHLYQYRVTAIDAVGNASAVRTGGAFRPTLYQSNTSATVYSTGWGSSSSSSFSGGSTKYSSTAGKYATFTATNARSIAIVSTKAASRGSFKVYVDGVFKATISTYSTTTRYRQLVYQFSWSAPGTHKIKVVVVGTAGHPRVDLDAFVVLR